jgi:hypothetical protein
MATQAAKGTVAQHHANKNKKPAAAPTKKPAAAPAKAAAKPQPPKPAVEYKVYPIDAIIQDADLQQRAGLDEALVKEYSQEMINGAVFPPVDAFLTPDKQLILADGFQRIAAATLAGQTEIAVNVHRGTKDDAIWFSCAANKAHGKRRSNEDKRKAVHSALTIEKTATMSDRAIAEHCGTSPSMVGVVRKEMIKAGEIAPVTERISTDGKKIDVSPEAVGRRSQAGKASAASRAPEPSPEDTTEDTIVDDADLLSDSDVQTDDGSENIADESAPAAPKPAKATAPTKDANTLDAENNQIPEELREVFSHVDTFHKLVQFLYAVAGKYAACAKSSAGTFLDPDNEAILTQIADDMAAATPYVVNDAYADGWAPTKPESVTFNADKIPAAE